MERLADLQARLAGRGRKAASLNPDWQDYAVTVLPAENPASVRMRNLGTLNPWRSLGRGNSTQRKAGGQV